MRPRNFNRRSIAISDGDSTRYDQIKMFFSVDFTDHKDARMSKHFAAIHSAMKVMFCLRLVLRKFGYFFLQRFNASFQRNDF